MPVVSSYLSNLRYINSMWLMFHYFVALEEISSMYLTMLSIALIQRSMHRVRDRAEPYTDVLVQSSAISNMFLDHEQEKS